MTQPNAATFRRNLARKLGSLRKAAAHLEQTDKDALECHTAVLDRVEALEARGTKRCSAKDIKKMEDAAYEIYDKDVRPTQNSLDRIARRRYRLGDARDELRGGPTRQEWEGALARLSEAQELNDF